MPVPQPTPRYYPKLSEIVTVEQLPDFLSFVQEGLNEIFDRIYYKNLKYSKSVRGDAAFYSLDIVTKDPIKLPLGGGFAFVLNPDYDGSPSISSFPITVEYQWEILAFLRSFSLEGFSFSIEDFYMLGLQVFRITEDQVLAHVLNNFVIPDEGVSKYQQVLDDVSDFFIIDPPLQFPPDTEPSLNALISVLGQHPTTTNIKVSLLTFMVYINGEEEDDVKKRLQEFYNIVVPEGIEAYIRKIIVPKAKATLELSAALEFPVDILKPVDEQGVVLPGETTKFVFATAQLYADTEAGIGYQMDLGGYLLPAQAEVLNSGLLLRIDNLKLDLSKKKNIAEADLDGRPSDFTGIYARAVEVTLPTRWFKNNDDTQSTSNTTLRLGGYDILIGTGGVSGTIMLEAVPITTGGVLNDYFSNKFEFNYPITAYSKNEQDVVSPVSIISYPNLLAFLNQQQLSHSSTTFKFPLSLKTLPFNQIKVFTNAVDYQKYLAGLDGDENILWKKIGNNGFEVGFKEFDLTLKQNSIVSSNIKGKLKIPRLKKNGLPFEIDITGHLQDDGDFNLTALSAEGVSAQLGNFVVFNFTSLELGKEDGVFYIGTSVDIEFPSGIMNTITHDKKISIPRVRFYADGSFEIEGGSAFLPIALHLPLGPVDMNVTGIHFGSIQREKGGVQRKYNFVGFDGTISVDPFSIEARGEGVKYYYTSDDGPADSYLHIETIEIDMTIPNELQAASWRRNI